MREITITRALAELKLLGSKIDGQVAKKFVTANKKSSGKIDGVVTEEVFKQNAKASLDSVVALIENRKLIKTAIVTSNATTKVEIGGKEMTVAEAIERKDSINYEKDLLSNLKSQYKMAVSKVYLENEKVQAKVDDLLIATFGKDSKTTNQDAIKTITEPYEAQNQWQLVDSIGVEELITKMENDIMEFESNVDFVLSESNSINKITVE